MAISCKHIIRLQIVTVLILSSLFICSGLFTFVISSGLNLKLEDFNCGFTVNQSAQERAMSPFVLTEIKPVTSLVAE